MMSVISGHANRLFCDAYMNISLPNYRACYGSVLLDQLIYLSQYRRVCFLVGAIGRSHNDVKCGLEICY